MLAFLSACVWWVGLIAISTTVAILVLCVYVSWRDRLVERRFRLQRLAAIAVFDYECDGLDGRLR